MKTGKWYKNMITAVISFAMIIGIFNGMQMEACAAKNYTFDVNSNDFEAEMKKVTFEADDTLTIGDSSQKYKNGYYYADDGNGGSYANSITFGYYNTGTLTFSELKQKYNISNPQWQVTEVYLGTLPQLTDETICIIFKLVDGSSSTPSSNPSSEDPNPSQEGSVSESGSDTGASTPSHECNFQWVTTVEPQPGVDGLEEYKCVTCGAVKESRSIPANMATVKNLYGFIKDAPENGTVTTDFGTLHTISDYLLKKMAERSDATVTIQFEYKNQKLQITFPAGTDYTPVLNDTDTMYGFYGVAAKLGLTVTERQ